MGSMLFEPFSLRSVTFRNRIGLSPMCMYSSEDGFVSDWHATHLASRSVGGVGLVMTEATAVSPEGRITPNDLGIWKDEHVSGLRSVVQAIEAHGGVAAIQLAHAGQKAGCYRPWSPVRGQVPKEDGGWLDDLVSSSALPFRPENHPPRAASLEDIARLQDDFVAGARRALEAGFKVLEIHSAHGYLIHQFHSPISNQREDEYGGSFENRTRFLREIATRTRAIMPDEAALLVRLSTTDWVEGGWTVEESIRLSRELRELGVDLIDCSSGGATADAPIPYAPGYQAPIAGQIRAGADIPTAAVGYIMTAEQAEHILRQRQADMVFIGRKLLEDPYWPMRAAKTLGEEPAWASPYAWAVKNLS